GIVLIRVHDVVEIIFSAHPLLLTAEGRGFLRPLFYARHNTPRAHYPQYYIWNLRILGEPVACAQIWMAASEPAQVKSPAYVLWQSRNCYRGKPRHRPGYRTSARARRRKSRFHLRSKQSDGGRDRERRDHHRISGGRNEVRSG